MDLLLDAISRGVCVYLLLEANPVGGINDEELYIAGKIKEGGGKVRFSDAPFINHAKYAIVDNKTTVIESENWKNTGIPYDNSFGNRGWGIVIRNENLANYFNEVFFEDFQRGEDFFAEKKSIKDFIMSREISEGSYEPLFDPLTLNCNVTVMPVLAPDTVLSDETILGMVNSASKSIFVEQFSVQRIWDGENNPFIDALIEAARRGCEVKVLLDSKDYNLDTRNDNDEAVAYINEIAKVEELNLEAKLANLDGLVKVHNKGLIVDGEKTLISSLNWNANSIQNREAGVMVENAEIAFFYIDVFLHDWNMPAGKEGEKEPVTKIAYIVLTLLICFAISITIKWYKRI
jgi:phosphatidylserine/phosphatidylglycerophosphate/cardiolipin synthase-like enzyme